MGKRNQAWFIDMAGDQNWKWFACPRQGFEKQKEKSGKRKWEEKVESGARRGERIAGKRGDWSVTNYGASRGSFGKAL